LTKRENVFYLANTEVIDFRTDACGRQGGF